MHFENELENIEKSLNRLECKYDNDMSEIIGKLQIFVQGELPGLLSRISSGDSLLLYEVNKCYKLFLNDIDYNGKSFFKIDREIRGIAKSVNDLFLKVISLAESG